MVRIISRIIQGEINIYRERQREREEERVKERATVRADEHEGPTIRIGSARIMIISYVIVLVQLLRIW